LAIPEEKKEVQEATAHGVVTKVNTTHRKRKKKKKR